jgi:hypothetical protein
LISNTAHKLIFAAAIVTSPVFGIVSAHAEWAEWFADGEIKYYDNDNINYSAFANDELSDNAIVPFLSIGRYKQVGDNTRLRLAGELELGKFDEFDKLDFVRLGAAATLRHKLGLGPDVPWISGEVSVSALDVDSNIRDDGTLYEFAIRSGKRFTPRLDGQIGIEYFKRDGIDGPVVDPAIPSNVFDQEHVALVLEGGFLLSETALLTVGYSYRSGDFDSACTGPNVAQVLAVEDVKAITFDDAFNLAVPMCAYKLDGKTNIFEASLLYSWNPNWSVEVGIEHRDGKGDVLEYDATIVRFGVVYVR